MVASKALAQKYTDEELVHSLLYGFLADGTCSAGTYEDFNRSPYSGKIQIWRDCDPKDSTYVVLAASPTEDRKCVAVLGVEAVSEAGREALGHILDTFEVDSANSAKPRSERRVGLLP